MNRVYDKLMLSTSAVICLLAGASIVSAQAQELNGPRMGQDAIFTPSSSRPVFGAPGRQMHTHVRVLVTEQKVGPQAAAASVSPYETPASLACLYGQVAATAGCIPGQVSKLATGGSRIIAIVDAYDDPNIAADLATYSKQFGLAAPNLTVVYANGTRPAQDKTGGWELETALDVEMAHALAPSAALVLVEAASSATADLLKAVDVAGALVSKGGGGEVSMSWGGGEFSGQTSYDSHFASPNVVYLAASGDAPGVEWPASSANVVGVGGTSVSRTAGTGALIGEASWSNGGGGPSAIVPLPAYQNGVSKLTGARRATPDVAAVADPNTPVLVYDSLPLEGSTLGWATVGGTSVATPVMAAIINASGSFKASSAAQLTVIYGHTGSSAFNAISRGICGPYAGYSPGGAWNPCVGVGSPLGRTAF